MILAGDVGGTKVRLALFQYCIQDPLDIEIVAIEQYQSQDFIDFNSIISTFINKYKADVEIAVIGVPGPVFDGSSAITNLPWMIHEEGIKELLGISAVHIVNDLYATANSISVLSEKQVSVLHKGNPRGNMKAILAPGTGLGQAFLVDKGKSSTIIASEGGHSDFAPTTLLQSELLSYLLEQYDHVSYERVLSGSGLMNIYNFLKETKREEEPPILQEELQLSDPGTIITRCALAKKYSICMKTINIFASILGAQAGNCALTIMATNGVYLGGGMPARILPLIPETDLLSSYLNKGRLSHVVAKIPLHIITDDRAALIGAALLAVQIFRD